MGYPLKDWDCQRRGQNHDLIEVSQSWAHIHLKCSRCGYETGASA